ncbi:sensor histidine kinase [Membranihabitans maritimus]|uniref:sensor histidine kinase n=1 Tax=Membranihabitans maritimus TaxID=2904244 RepID=UPI001F02F47C|nr:histidine kinase [Membranihabitans maritimus]
MVKVFKKLTLRTREIIFQVILHGLVFIFYAVSRQHPQFESYEIPFFLNYALLAFIINYFLLPKFLYQKKYTRFILFLLLTLVGVILIEELFLEQIFFPDTRGTNFPGIFFTLLGILPVSTILVGLKTIWDAFVKQRELEELQNAATENELQFLKSQINPHFLFNNLNNLYAHAIEGSSKTPDIILELSSVLRYMLYDCKARYVALDKEVEQLENFINISEMQIEDRGKVTFETDIQYGYKIAPLLLSVFVENAFKHSTASQAKDIDIYVKVKVTVDGELHFTCENTFARESNISSISSGIGLENVRKRLQLLYPDQHHLDISIEKNRYKVFLSLSLNRIGEEA